MRTYQIESFTYEMRSAVLPLLGTAVAESGGWVIERGNVSAERLELMFELQTRAVLELYAALAAAGVELTRQSQQSLIALCGEHRYVGRHHGLPHTVRIRLVVRFLEDALLPAFSSVAAVM